MYYSGGINQRTGEVEVYHVGEGGYATPLDPRLDLRNHSPTGFQWGYSGSGPAQLSLAILADFLKDDDQALDAYQVFKFRVIAQLPQGKGWTLTSAQIDEAFAKIKQEVWIA